VFPLGSVYLVLAAHPLWFGSAMALLGLVIGSFLNVIIHRIPLILQREWAAQCQALRGEAPSAAGPVYSIALPASHCPHCQTPLRLYDNIPLLSFIALGGRCRYCRATIAWRYPAIELLSATLSFVIAIHFGPNPATLAALVLTYGLIALTGIDLEHQLLPDTLTLPLIWAGLWVNTGNIFTTLHAAVLGTIWGYGTLWALFHVFKRVTGKEGMGYGDFKLFAVAGAWLGWLALPVVILVASFSGAVVGLSLIALKRHDQQTPIPFGPFLCAGILVALLWNNALVSAYLQWAH